MKPELFLLLAVWPAAAEPVGSAACRPCHLAQHKSQSESGHARALSRDGKVWNFGSGLQAITPVSRAGPETYLEHGVTKYRRTGQEGLTPGHKDAKGVRYEVFHPGSQVLRCFQCHSTGGVAFDPEGGVGVKEMGVRCESCHGPGGEHVRNGGGKGNLFQPRMLNGAGMNDFCGNCHRKPPEPGENTDWRDPWNARHQPLGLSQSACFIRSGGSLGCTTCHDPHNARPVTANACAGCHAAPKHATPLAKGASCTSCHMPAVKPSPELQFANHWIGVYRPSDPLVPRR